MTSRGPLVSVVIPAFNAQAFIRDAVESVLEQTYRDIECVVVDDGSSDQTLSILRHFAKQIMIISQSNAGVARARNVGIEAASGELVAFLDADDVWLPRKLEKQVAIMIDDPQVALVYTGVHLVNADLHFIGRIDPPTPDAALENTLLLRHPVMSVAQTGLFNSDALRALGGFDERLSTSADADLACRTAASYVVSVVPEPLVKYRIHDRQMHSDPSRVLDDMTKCFEKIFSSDSLPPLIRRRKREAKANLYVSLAGLHLQRGEWWHFLTFATRALFSRPDRVLAALTRLSRPSGGLSRR